VMADWGGGFAELDALAVTTGPGAFTGVRIGLATARGLALARGLPLIGISSLEVAAAAATAEERAGRLVLAVIDSKRGALFHQIFDDGLGELGPPAEIAPQDLAAALQAAGRHDVVVAAAAGPADAAILAERAALRDPADQVPVQPVYLRQPDVTPPKPAPRG